MVSRDTLWKGIIEDLAEEMLHFFFPKYTNDIDFTRGFEFLDKELEQILPASETQLRRADKLLKGWLKSGEEHWFLIHVSLNLKVNWIKLFKIAKLWASKKQSCTK